MTPARRRTLELARIDLAERIEHAQVAAHKQMLQRALADVDRQLREP
jgi:hypothetical protein